MRSSIASAIVSELCLLGVGGSFYGRCKGAGGRGGGGERDEVLGLDSSGRWYPSQHLPSSRENSRIARVRGVSLTRDSCEGTMAAVFAAPVIVCLLKGCSYMQSVSHPCTERICMCRSAAVFFTLCSPVLFTVIALTHPVWSAIVLTCYARPGQMD